MSDVTNQKNGGLPGNPPEVTVEEARRLKAEGDRLFNESAQLGAQADLAHAQAEIVLKVIERREMLAEAQAELERARHNLARAVAFHDPVAAELEQVTAELASTDPDGVEDLDARLAARQRVYALQDEVGPLQLKLQARQQAILMAEEAVRSYEVDQVPMAQAELERAVSALLNPPFDDMAKLFELAPLAAESRIQRVGLAMVNVANASTPHGYFVAARVRQFMANTGQLALYQEFWLDGLKRKLDPQTFANVQRALAPPEPNLFQPDTRRMPPPMEGDPAWRPGSDPARLPPVGSLEAKAQSRVHRPVPGPADWPSNNGVRAPF